MKIVFILGLLFVLQSCHVDPRVKLDSVTIKHELDSIMVLDQKYRSRINDLYLEHSPESEEFKSVIHKQRIIDSLNLIYVEDLIDKYGKYPGKSLVGHSTGEVVFFVLQHAPDSIQSKYINLILEASSNNELKKSSVAMFHDRYLIYQGEAQIYGTQIGSKQIVDSISGKSRMVNFIYPIIDTVNIDSLRMWNGLPSLESYLNSFGLIRE